MPALNFQAQFAPLVESGAKRQTIRAYRKDGRDPEVGDKLFLFTGMRTLACRRLAIRGDVDVAIILVKDRPPRHVVRCKSVAQFKIWRGFRQWNCLVSDRGSLKRKNARNADAFARADGFTDWLGIVDWFEKTHGLPFEGLLIRW
jgi:hypothetical protein